MPSVFTFPSTCYCLKIKKLRFCIRNRTSQQLHKSRVWQHFNLYQFNTTKRGGNKVRAAIISLRDEFMITCPDINQISNWQMNVSRLITRVTAAAETIWNEAQFVSLRVHLLKRKRATQKRLTPAKNGNAIMKDLITGKHRQLCVAGFTGEIPWMGFSRLSFLHYSVSSTADLVTIAILAIFSWPSFCCGNNFVRTTNT